MDIIVIAAIVGCIIGLAIGTQTVQSPPQPITIVQIEPEPIQQRGCLPTVFVIIVIVILIGVIGS